MRGPGIRRGLIATPCVQRVLPVDLVSDPMIFCAIKKLLVGVGFERFSVRPNRRRPTLNVLHARTKRKSLG